MKTPVPDARGLPRCYALSFDRTAGTCRRCRARTECSRLCERRTEHRSLAERLAEAQHALAPERLDCTRLEQIYDELYLAHFGRRSRRKRSHRNDVLFGRLLSFLLKEEIDPVTFIAANMEMLGAFCRESPYGFQPNMLSGEKARARYNIYLRKANRRFKRGRADAFASTTELGKFRAALARSEADVGELFVRGWEWEDAIEQAVPDLIWIEVRAGTARVPYDLDKEIELATLTAAVEVAERVAPGLSHRVGFRRWSWEAFRSLVRRLYPEPEKRRLDIDGIDGLLHWS